MSEEHQHIQRGFNAGYTLEKLQPELAKSIREGFSNKQHPYAVGFIAGGEEYTKEITPTKGKLTHMKKYIDAAKQRPKTNNKSKGKDTSDI